MEAVYQFNRSASVRPFGSIIMSKRVTLEYLIEAGQSSRTFPFM